MNEQKARKILEGRMRFATDGSREIHISWTAFDRATGDSHGFDLNADELEAIAWWMRNKGGAS